MLKTTEQKLYRVKLNNLKTTEYPYDHFIVYKSGTEEEILKVKENEYFFVIESFKTTPYLHEKYSKIKILLRNKICTTFPVMNYSFLYKGKTIEIESVEDFLKYYAVEINLLKK